MKKQQRQKKVLIPSMYFANYSKSKNMSVGTVCIKRFKFACMTLLSPETVSIVLCQCFVMDMQVPLCQISPRLLKFTPKMHPKSPEPPLREGRHPLSCSPPPLVPSALALNTAGPLLNTWRRACFDQARFKLACSFTVTSYSIKI